MEKEVFKRGIMQLKYSQKETRAYPETLLCCVRNIFDIVAAWKARKSCAEKGMCQGKREGRSSTAVY